MRNPLRPKKTNIAVCPVLKKLSRPAWVRKTPNQAAPRRPSSEGVCLRRRTSGGCCLDCGPVRSAPLGLTSWSPSSSSESSTPSPSPEEGRCWSTNVEGATHRSSPSTLGAVSYTHLRAHETDSYLVCRLLLEKK